MDIPKALVGRLCSHANLPLGPDPDELTGFVLSVIRYTSGQGGLSSIRSEFSDLMTCLGELNKFVNGQVPSSVPWSSKVRHINRVVVYALHGIVRGILAISDSHSRSASPDEIQAYQWAVVIAIDAVYSGDIDDIDDHVNIALRVRGLSIEPEQDS